MKTVNLILLCLSGILLIFCTIPDSSKKIYYINSYHPGYGSSDDVMEGITEILADKNVALKTFFMDTKRKSSEKEMLQATQDILNEIKEFQPDILIASDDNAVKYIIQPHFNNKEIPVVFCGVNWSAKQYGLGKNVTGMLEVIPLRECISEVLKNYPETKNFVVLSENSLSEQNNTELLDTMYRNLGLTPKYLLVKNFEQWKNYFKEANETADLIYMPTNGAIKNWDNNEAKKLIEEALQIPAITCDDFMMPFVVFGLTKIAKEQGIWAAETALEILDGTLPSKIPFAKNSQSKAWRNKTLAEKVNFKLSDEIQKQVNITE
ncbi:MAG: ABC transporter substrate binding protein [Draconibacterium sp.]|nr:ABC transporter substrate binding protein [Draconibacterium sp.]